MSSLSTPSNSFTRVTASDLGCALDCNIATGLSLTGGTPTNDTAVMQAFLASASPTQVRALLIDGGSETTGLTIPTGNCIIEGLNYFCGLYVKSGSNFPAIYNGGNQNDGGTAPTQENNFTLRNIRINGNRPGNSTSSDPHGSGFWICAVNLAAVNYVLLENVFVYDSPTYAFILHECNSIVMQGCRIESPSNAVNTDGLHLDGGCQDVRVSDCYFNCGDDSIALNSPEGVGGNIGRVTVTNCIFENCASAMRLYSQTSGYIVSQVVMSNCVGSFIENTSNYETAVVILGLNENGSKPQDVVADFSMSNCTWSSVGNIADIGDPCGAISFRGVTWRDPTNPNPWVYFVAVSTVSSLEITDCRIYRTTLGNAAAYGIYGNASTVKKLRINGWSVENEAGTSYPPIPYLIDMFAFTINELVIDALDPTNITSLVNPATGFTGIGSISGPGVLATGWEFPDNIMANGTPYISSTSGLPSIKIGGVVKTYNLS
jgi:hypothetical protein